MNSFPFVFVYFQLLWAHAPLVNMIFTEEIPVEVMHIVFVTSATRLFYAKC